MTQIYLGSTPVDPAVLDGAGGTLTAALAGRVPDGDPALQRFLSRRAEGILDGWRITFEGPAPDFPHLHLIAAAAPVADGWKVATFTRQDDGGWTVVDQGPVQLFQV